MVTRYKAQCRADGELAPKSVDTYETTIDAYRWGKIFRVSDADTKSAALVSNVTKPDYASRSIAKAFVTTITSRKCSVTNRPHYFL
jgi:hypothetical protein